MTPTTTEMPASWYADPERPPEQRARRRLFIIAALVLVALATGAFGFIAYAGAQADERDALRAQFDEDMKAAAVKAEKEKDSAVSSAVAKQKTQDTKLLKRVKIKAKRDAKKAFERGQSAGYSSGSAAGYASGSADGYSEGAQDGLLEGSDELTCSDDPDVYWLPACFF